MRSPSIATLLPSAVRTATQTVDPRTLLVPLINTFGSSPLLPMPASSVIVYLDVSSAPAIETLTLKLQEMNPISLVWTDIPGAANLPQVAVGLIKVIMGVGVSGVAAAVSGVTFNSVLPPFWRVVVAHSAGGNWTYSLAVAVDL